MFTLVAGCIPEEPTPPEPPEPPPVATIDAAGSTLEITGTALANGVDTVSISGRVVKTDGAPAGGLRVTLTVSGEGNQLTPAEITTDGDGKLNATLSSTAPGVKQVTATVDSVTLAARPTIEFAPRPASKLAFLTTSISGIAGAPLQPAIEVEVLDDAGQRVAGSHVVTLELLTGQLEGTTTVTAIDGVARFEGLFIEATGRYTLRATSPALSATDGAAFDVVAASAASLEIASSAMTMTAGTSANLEVTVKDAFGNIATNYTGSVALTSTDLQATLPAAFTFSASDSGRKTFTVSLRTAGTQSLIASDGANLTASTMTQVVAAAATTLVFIDEPQQRSVRAALDTVRVGLRDAFGNTSVVTAPDVTLALDPTGQLGGALTATPVNGIASFTGLNVVAEGSYRLNATANGLTAASSMTFAIVDDVPPGVPVLTQGATTANSISVSWTAVGDDGALGDITSHEVRYSLANITTDAEFVAATPVSMPAPATPGTNQSVTIPNLFPSTNYFVALRVVDSAGNATRSVTLPVSTPNAQVTQLVFSGQPTNGTAGQTLPSVQVTLRDAQNQTVTTATTAVTLTFAGGPSIAPVTVNAVNGVATFSTLRVDTAGTGFTFVASAAGVADVPSQTFSIAAAATAVIDLTGLATTVGSGGSNGVQITARDAFGNVATSYTGTIHFSSNDTAATLPANYTFTAADNGVKSFTGIVFRTSGPRTLTVTDTVTGTLIDSLMTTVQAGAATRLELAAPTTVTAGSVFSIDVTLRDAIGNIATGYVGTVHLTSSDAQASLAADYTFTASDNGQKTFSITSLRTAGAQSLTVSDTTNAALSDSKTLTVRPGTAATLSLAAPSTATAGSTFAVTLIARDAHGNVATGFTGTAHFSSSDASAVLPADFTFTSGDSGQKIFSGVTLRAAATTTITATSGSLNATSTTVVSAAAATALAFTSVPTSINVRDNFTVTIVLRDAYGNAVSTSGTDVTLSLSSGTATLTGTSTVTANNGAATFDTLSIDDEGTTFALTASATGFTSAISNTFTVVDDLAPAAAVLSASVSGADSVDLTWLAVGDDGQLGTAAVQELRHASTPITNDAEFASATPVTIGAPQASGTSESVTVSGLNLATPTYFALRISDGAGNRSLSNSASASDPCSGFLCTAPAAACSADGTAVETYTSSCVVNAGAPTCVNSVDSTQPCTGADAVCVSGACAVAVAPDAGEFAITEVMHSPSAATTEYVELTNLSTKLLVVNGLTVTFADGVTTPASFTVQSTQPVAAGGRVVFAANGNVTTNGGVNASYAWGNGIQLANSGTITLERGTTTITALTYTSSFPQTTGRAMSLASSIIGTTASQNAWYWCDSTGTLPGGDRGTPGVLNDDCGFNVEKPLNYCAIQYPKTFPSSDGVYSASIPANASRDIFSQFYSYDVTTRNTRGNDGYPAIEAQLGYGTDSTNPSGWTWVNASPNVAYAPMNSNNDEMKGVLSIPTPGTYVYGFRYRFSDPGAAWVYCDQFGISSPPSGTYGSVTVVTGPQTNHVVISEFSGGNGTGAAATDEYVELYNPTNAAVDLSNWRVSYKSATGTTWSSAVTIPAGKSIAAHGYFLLGGATYSGTAPKDVGYGFDASASTTAGGHIRLENATLVEIDKLGWGTGNLPEGTAAPSHPATGGSLERKAFSTSTSATMAQGGADALRGNAQDTNNNSVDFVTRAIRQPQSTTSPTESF